MFFEKIGESCLTTGTVPYSMSGAYKAFRAWRAGPANGENAFYLATNDSGSIWELGYGPFTVGTPDTLGRNLIASSSGSLISWTTTPYRIYSVPSATIMKHMLAPLASNRPAWLPAGALWLDYTLGLAVAWVKKRWNGSADIEEGRFYLGSDNLFAASQRTLFVDIGAANYVMTANDIGKTFAFDCTAAARTLTMLAHDATGMGPCPYIFVMPYGSTVNGVTFTPGGTDTTDLATAPAGCRTLFMWDASKSKWRSNYKAPVNVLPFPLGSTFNNLKILVTSNTAISATADLILMSDGVTNFYKTAFSKTIATGTVGAGGLDAGTIANSTWYNVFAIGGTNGTTNALLMSLSATAPTMPTGYTFKARIGAVKTDGSGNLMRTIQVNRRAQYIVGTNPASLPQIFSGTTSGAWTAASLAALVPPTACVLYGSANALSGGVAMIAPNNSYSFTFGSQSNPPPVMIYGTNQASTQMAAQFSFVLESINIYWSNAASGSNAVGYVTGWEDNL